MQKQNQTPPIVLAASKKKQYTKPEFQVVKLNAEVQLLQGSNPTSKKPSIPQVIPGGDL